MINIRTLSLLIGCWSLFGVGAPAQAVDGLPQAVSTLVVSGGGWGHSTGMSQYGAQGQAKAGASFAQILSHYYGGASLAALGTDLPHPGNVWVGLEQNLTRADIGIGGVAGSLVTITRDAEIVQVPAPGVVTLTFSPTGCALSTGSVAWPSGSCWFEVGWDGWTPQPQTILYLPNNGGASRAYSRGFLHVRPNQPNPTGFHLSLEIDMQHYLYGLGEVPSSWHPEALKAQAVAARSYGVNRMVTRGLPEASATQQLACWCQLYDTVRDQNYVGREKEIEVGGANWVAAVDATAGLVLSHPEAVDASGARIALPAYYSSSSFGHTEDSGFAFGSGVTPSYLRGVPDAWSVDPTVGNKFASWTEEKVLTEVAAALGMSTITGATITGWSRSGAAAEVTFTGLAGGGPASLAFSTPTLRTKLKLRSSQLTAVSVKTVAPGYQLAMHDPTSGIVTIRSSDGSTQRFYFGIPSDQPVMCDWNGDGIDTVGLFRASSGFLYLRNSNTQGVGEVEIFYGIPGDKPVCGDWDGDGVDSIGVFRSSNKTFYLRNSITQGFADLTFGFNLAGSVPVAGDWNGDGIDTVGLYDTKTRTLRLAASNQDSSVATTFAYTNAQTTDRLVIGDWNGDRIDTVGVYRPADYAFYLRDAFSQSGPADYTVKPFGEPFMNPLAGVWG